jgi:beta-glucosidase
LIEPKNQKMKNLFSCLAFIIVFCANAQQKTKTKTNSKQDTETKINDLISKMTLEEKSGMLHGATIFSTAGVPRLGIPALKMDDGSLGIREEVDPSWKPMNLETDFATFYPAPGALAATWNLDLAHLYGNSIGEEARARSVDILLAPAFNIIRTPLGGRTYEYFTEDPFLNKKLVVASVKGIQEKDVATCVKHFAVNNQETNRHTVNVKLSDRVLREIYLPAFESAVKEANTYSIMGSYNKLFGEHLCENKIMLTDLLKKEWGFEGVVISDWDATHSTIKSLRAGLDIEMGTAAAFDKYYLAQPLIDSVKSGKIQEKELDDHLRRILRLMFNTKMLGNASRTKGSINTPKHLKDTYDIASESVVLLKNTQNSLPINLKRIKSIALIGANATNVFANGGWGSGVKTKNEPTFLEAFKAKIPSTVKLNYAQGYQEKYKLDKPDDKPFGKPTIDVLEPTLLAEAIEAAKKSDLVLLVAGSNRISESEGSDRKSLELPFGQNEFIKKIKEVNPNIITVIVGGAPYNIRTVEQNSLALIWTWFNGSEGSNALADIILGKINPSGKLPWTIPNELKDSPAHATNSFPGDTNVEYKEGLLVGYRWFDTKKIDPHYPFGYGLSYTNFDFLSSNVNKNIFTENDGSLDGKEVVQVYVSKLNSKVERAEKELKGFKKMTINKAQTQKVVIEIPVKELAYYNETEKKWTVEKGMYILKVGNSSRNYKNEITIEIK